MKLLKLLMAKIISMSVILVGFVDILEPIYSFGEYIVYLLFGITIYIIYLAFRFDSANDLIHKEKAFANIPVFKDFYIEHWRSGVITTLITLLLISASGAYFTDKYKDSGGFLANNFDNIQNIQNKLSEILNIQKDVQIKVEKISNDTDIIKQDTNKIRENLDIIKKNYDRINLKELVVTLKKSDNPYSELNRIIMMKYVEEPYLIEDVNYIIKLSENKNNSYIYLITQNAIKNCKKHSFSEKDTISYIKALKKAHDHEPILLNFDKILDIKECVNTNDLNNIVEQLLQNEDGYFLYDNYPKNGIEKKDMLNLCKHYVKEEFFKNVKINKKNINKIKSFLKDTKKYGTNCVSVESLKLLNKRINYIAFINNKYSERNHIYSHGFYPQLDKTFFTNLEITNDNDNDIKNYLKDSKKYVRHDVPEKSLKLLNERLNHYNFLKGRYYSSSHIYSSGCYPKINMSTIKIHQDKGFDIDKSDIKNGLKKGCVIKDI